MRGTTTSATALKSFGERFNGALSESGTETGVRMLHASAARLTRDARLLYHAKRYASAAMLAGTALDEMARLFILLDIFGENSDRKNGWNDFREVPPKVPWAILEANDDENANTINDALSMIRRVGNTVECLKPGFWVDPEKLILPGLVRELIGVCELICLSGLNDDVMRVWLETARVAPKRARATGLLDRFHDALVSAGLKDAASNLQLFRNHMQGAPAEASTEETQA